MYFLDLLKALLGIDAMALNQASANVSSYLESTGVVESPIRIGRKGRIRLCGVYWFARASDDRIIAIGEHVRAIGRNGNTLHVEPIESPAQMPIPWSHDQVS